MEAVFYIQEIQDNLTGQYNTADCLPCFCRNRFQGLEEHCLCQNPWDLINKNADLVRQKTVHLQKDHWHKGQI